MIARPLCAIGMLCNDSEEPNPNGRGSFFMPGGAYDGGRTLEERKRTARRLAVRPQPRRVRGAVRDMRATDRRNVAAMVHRPKGRETQAGAVVVRM